MITEGIVLLLCVICFIALFAKGRCSGVEQLIVWT